MIGTPLLYQGAAASDRTCNKAKGGDASSTRRVEEAKCYDASGAKVNRILFGSSTKLAQPLASGIPIGGSMEQGRSSAAECDLRRCARVRVTVSGGGCMAAAPAG